ncbi:myosin XI-2 [Thecamonas trahens ATCC 50062]|uniref:Myosin XI-2 n=1 Tax=Thecamonas trahens ATCC 50062 TaxID=461836 RepID=A0A0L0DPS6_THETB|nr:myosin XI-2 [Thecamonas trahens ATCC 50062]KNC53433.1 myosin XI-2 [Thecamonas trahens ATCC 50062]|eukprot:XP_013754468.1 myosin XI-2 [Thecamonas trahens ATCC 50062]
MAAVSASSSTGPGLDPEHDPSLWQELTTEDGLVYYYNAGLDITQEDKPACLRTDGDEAFDGAWAWVPDEQEGYVAGRVIETNANDEPAVIELIDGGTRRVPKKDQGSTFTLSPGSLRKNRDDLVQMGEIDEGIILHNLKKRFMEDTIYTNIGPILIIVNPYRWMKLYTEEIMEKVRNRGIQMLKPHIFNIADDAFRQLSEKMASGENPNQSILISGESGAGKTEATKQALKYLAHCAGSGETSGVEQKLLAANPLLEAFGNAATLRNHNSSRFGKWMEVFFDSRRRIVGAKINNYLLEKSRVSHQIGGERNFHIFYQLCQAREIAEMYSLGRAEEYAFVRGRTVIDDAHFSDAKDFAEVLEAMDMFNIKEGADRQSIFRLVAGILHFGNLEFARDDSGEGSRIRNPETLAVAASMFCVPEAALERAVLFRTLTFKRQDDVIVPLTPEQAADNRNALARTLYNSMFNWLVVRVNQVLAPKGGVGGLNLIGILDIFGFEIFQNNSFEQLCINYANEKLQQHFNQHTFKMEQQLYMDEGINFEEVKFVDNQPCLDLLERKPHGILIMLDEELLAPSGSDDRFLDKLNSRHSKKTERFSMAFRTPNTFNVEHYAGQVTYDVRGFLEKNKDTIEKDLLTLVHASTDQFIQHLFESVGADSKSRKQSTAFQFRTQLGSLMKELQATTPHYVRCIKPNSVFKPRIWSGRDSLLQLRYSGVFEAVRIRQTGFPFRYSHAEFIRRYGVFNSWARKSSEAATCKDILESVRGDFSEVQIGRTRVLYRAKMHRALEVRLSIILHRMATKAQAAFRGFRARKLFAQMKKVDAAMRAAMATLDVDTLRAAISEARAMWFQLGVTDEAERLCARLEEERGLNAAMERLRTAGDPEGNYEEIFRVISRAEELGVVNPDIAVLRESIRSIHERKQAVKDLEEGAREFDKKRLEAGLEAVSRLGISCAGAVATAQRVLDLILSEESLVSRCSAALYSAQDDLQGLQEALSEVSAFQIRTEAGKLLRSKLSATVGIRVAIRDQDWDGLRSAVDAALALGLAGMPDVVAAEEGLALRARMAEVGSALVAEVPRKVLPALLAVLAQARELEMGSSLYSSWRDEVAGAEAQAAAHAALLEDLRTQLKPLERTVTPARAVLELKTQIGVADEFGLVAQDDLALVEAARTLLAVREGVSGKEWRKLENAVASAARQPSIADHPEVAAGKEGLALRAKMLGVAGQLSTQMSARAMQGLAQALEDAEALDMKTSYWSTWEDVVVAGEVQLAQHKRIVKNLKACTGPGTQLQIDSLEAALADARAFGLRQPADTALVSLGTLLLELRRALAARDWAVLGQCVARAASSGISAPEVAQVKAGLELREQMHEVASRLSVAKAKHDSEALRDAMGTAVRLEMEDSMWSTWSELVVACENQLRRHLELLRALRATLAPGTSKLIDQLQSVLNNVAAFGFKTRDDCVLEEQGRITLSLRKAIAARAWDDIAGALASAAAAGYTSTEVSAANSGLELRAKMEVVATKLSKAAAAHDAKAMAADGYVILVDVVRTAGKVERQLVTHRAVVASLKETTAPGTSKLVEPLQDAIEAATEYGLWTDLDADLLRGAEITLQARIGFASRDWEAVRKATQAAFVAGHETSELRELAEGLKLRAKMSGVAEALRRAMEAHDAVALDAALLDASGLRMESSAWSTWQELMEKARAQRTQHADLLSDLRHWLSAGKERAIEPLADALAAGVQYGFCVAEDVQVLNEAKLVLQIRKGFDAKDYTSVRSQVRRATQLGLASSREIAAAAQVLEARSQMEATARKLKAAAAAHDAPALRAALVEARGCEMGTSPHSSWVSEVVEAKELLSKHRSLLVRLRVAAAPKSRNLIGPLAAALQEAIDFGLWTPADAGVQQNASIVLRARQALDAQSWQGLKAALDSALVAQLDNEEIRWYREGLALRHKMSAVAESLERAVRSRDVDALVAGVEEATTREVDMISSPWSSWSPLVDSAAELAEEGKSLRTRLRSSLEPPAEVGDASAAEAAHLALLDAADEYGFTLGDDLELVRQSRLYHQVRVALRSSDWSRLEATLRSALSFGMESPELAAAAEAVHLARQRAEMAALLKSAMQDVYNYERNVLGMALEQAEPLRLHESEYALLEQEAKKLAAQIETVRGSLESGTANVDAAELSVALELAADIGYETVQVASARVLLHEIQSIVDGASVALSTRDVKVLQQLLRRAKMINLRAPPIPEIEMKLPLFVYSEGDKQVKDFERLRDAESFASKKWFGRSSAAQSMLMWSGSPLPNSLTQLDSAGEVKIALQAFTNLLAYMGDRKSGGVFSSKKAGGEKPMRFLVELGRGNSGSPLADELYVQLVKQLSENPHVESEAFGWRLMEAYVQTFLPSAAFFVYLEWFLINQPVVDGRPGAAQYVAWLRGTRAEGAAGAASASSA